MGCSNLEVGNNHTGSLGMAQGMMCMCILSLHIIDFHEIINIRNASIVGRALECIVYCEHVQYL